MTIYLFFCFFLVLSKIVSFKLLLREGQGHQTKVPRSQYNSYYVKVTESQACTIEV